MIKKHWKIITPIAIAVALIVGIVIYGHLSHAPTYITHFSDSSDSSFQDYLQTAGQLTPRGGDSTTTVSFLAVGDIMLSRGVASLIDSNNNVDYPFENDSQALRSTNFNFANLESPVAPGKPVVGGSSLIFGAASSSLTALKDYNFQIINQANNHAFDQGIAGIDDGMATLNSLGIAHEGVGDTIDQAWVPAVVSSNGIKLCFIGAAYGTNTGGTIAAQYVAETPELTQLKAAFATAQTECDFVVVTMHAGIEYTRTPNQDQITFAHAAIDDGADIVIGAHPHWVQPIEKYKGKYIFYSLGNFIFDQNFSADTMEGLTLEITVAKDETTNPLTPNAATLSDLQGNRITAQLVSVQLLPVAIINSQPRPATPAETKTILESIKESQATLYP